MISLEQLADGSVSDRNFQRLMQLVPDTGGRALGVRWGSSSATWTAARDAADVTIPHGLGRAPVFVKAVSRTVLLEYALVSEDETEFVLRGYHTPGTTISGTFNFLWVAVG